MISVQSHAKQIKLLNDYIAALEKQISSSRKENQLLQTSSANSGQEQKRFMDDLNRLRSENGQVKYQNYKQQEQLRRLAGLQQEFFSVRQQLDGQIQGNNQLVQEKQRLEEALKKEQEQVKTTSEYWAKTKQLWEMEVGKDKVEIEELRKVQLTKDKKYTELTLMLSQERKNTTTKIGLIQAENTKMIASKNQSISKLTQQIEDLKNSLSFSIGESEKDKNELSQHVGVLEGQQSQSLQKIGKLQKEVKEMDSALTLRNNEILTLKNSLKIKTEEFDSLSKKSTGEKRTLLQAMDKQGDQKKRTQQKIKQFEFTINSKSNEINVLKSGLKTKTEEFDVLVRKASEEKLNLLEKVEGLSDSNTKMQERIKDLDVSVNLMSTEIASLRNNLKIKTEECEGLFKKTNGEKRSLLQSIDRTGEQKKKMEQSIRNLDLAIFSKSKEIGELKINLKAKGQQYEVLVEQTSEEKRILQQNIDRLTEEKKNLQILNNSCKGNIYENSKALTDALKQKEEVCLKLSSTSSLLQKTEKELEIKLNQIVGITLVLKERANLIEQLKATAIQREKTISRLSESLKNTENARVRAVKDGEGLTSKLNELHKQNTIQKQGFVRLTQQSESKILALTTKLQNLQKSKNQQGKRLNKIISDLEFERDSKNMDLSETGQRIAEFNHRMSDLHEEKNRLQQNLEAVTQEYAGYKKKKQLQTEELLARLKQSEKKVQKSRIKIQQLSREIQELQSHHENRAQNITLSQKEETERIEAKMNKAIGEIKRQSEEQIKEKNSQIEQLGRQIVKLGEQRIKSLKGKEEEFGIREQKLQLSLRQLTLENQSLQEQIKRGNQSVVFQKQSKSSKQFQFQSLKDKITLLEGTSQEQKKVIGELNTSIADRHKEYEVLEETNALLRKQLINVLTREETSRKELLDIKSTVGTAYLSKSRANLNQEDIENVSIYRNVAGKRRRTNVAHSTRLDQTQVVEMQRAMSRKMQAPPHLASSMVEEVTSFKNHYDNKV